MNRATDTAVTNSLHGYLSDHASNGQGCVTVKELSDLMGSWALAAHELEHLESCGTIERWCVIAGEIGYVLTTQPRDL